MRSGSTFRLIQAIIVFIVVIFLSAGSAAALERVSGKVQRGATASSLLNDYLPLKTILSLEKQARDVFPLTRIRQGRPYKIYLDDKQFVSFEYEINARDCLVIEKTKAGYAVSKSPIKYDLKPEVVAVEIRTSLAEAVQRAGERNTLTWRLADIFAWDIDFIRDIKPGDRFEALVEKRFREGKFCGYADIKAAFFTNQGTVYKAFLHEDESGRKRYYDETGGSLEKAFLKAPLNYSRISSAFSTRRYHPILKKYRAHPGVDYAAPKNTPIKAVADGVITSIYYNKTTGRQITLRHFSGYETSYFHMNKYARGMKKGRKVVQGEVIGYVGKTGLATGYHLCFRMRKNGRPVNPLKQTPSAGKPVSKKNLLGFHLLAERYSQQIQAHNKLAGSAIQ
ncbi:MAG: peptidoglycan DD-metalloendopeptidase family protein [Desulfobacter sp.]|nr:MAG: peptidoglycan DD-metalloendopeptidase family protein [Desulfobacter sp.]